MKEGQQRIKRGTQIWIFLLCTVRQSNKNEKRVEMQAEEREDEEEKGNLVKNAPQTHTFGWHLLLIKVTDK